MDEASRPAEGSADEKRARARLVDVAALAGVSQKTVSNVVNNYPFVADHTRARVLAAIEELGYRPNLSARNLARGRAGVIALIVPELPNTYFAELAALTLEEADKLSLSVLIEQTGGDPDREREGISAQRSRMVDGIIMSVFGLDAADLAERTTATPLVILGERVVDSPVHHVTADNVAAAEELTTHLLVQGRRRIAVVGMEPALQPGLATLRYEGYRRALEAHDVALAPELVVEVPHLTRECGYEAMVDLLARTDVDAVLCFNDLVGIGVLKALTQTGRRVPEEIAVVGFDNTGEGAFANPGLTSVDWHTADLVRSAVDILNRRINGETDLPLQVVTPHSLVVRGSSTP